MTQQLNERVVQGRIFDYSPTHGTWLLKEGELTLALDGDQVVPLEYYQLKQTDTVHRNGDVSRTREITPIPATQQLEAQRLKTAIARERIHEQLYNVVTGAVAFFCLVGGIFFAYVAAMYAGALAATAHVAVGGAALALSEIMYVLTWGVFVIGVVVAAYYLLRRVGTSTTTAAPTVTPTAPVRDDNAVIINVNQGGGYNSAQNIVQG